MIESLQPVINALIVIALLCLTGAVLRFLKIIDETIIKSINTVMIKVAQPALMIYSTQKSYTNELLRDFMSVLIFSFIFLTVSMLIVYRLTSGMKPERRKAFTLAASMPNIAYIGAPIVQATFGNGDAMIYIAAFIISFNLSVWTIGAAIASGSGFQPKKLVNPVMAAAILGLILFLLRIRLPAPLLTLSEQFTNLNTPLAMLLVGARLAEITRSDLRDRQIWTAIVIRMCAMPILAILFVRLLRFPTTVAGVSIICAAMPCAAVSQILTEAYNGDVRFAARAIAISTMLSVITIPLLRMAIL